MTENVQDTPVGDIGQGQGPPTPQVTPTSQQAASTPTGASVDALVNEVLQRLEDTLDAKVDQRFKKTTDPRFADVRRVAEYLQKAGNDPEIAARNMLLDDMLAEKQSPSSERPAGTVSDEEANAEIKAVTTLILDGAGIAYGDPRYTALYEQYKDSISSPQAWERVLKTAVEAWSKQAQPIPGAVVTEGQRPPAPPSLQAEYEAEVAKIKQGDIAALTQLKEAYRKKGLDVW